MSTRSLADVLRAGDAAEEDGLVHRVSVGGSVPSAPSSHGCGGPEAVELADALGRAFGP
ncbi:hypothetical protein SUDANB95_03428 [Actinosynnema sp. ALI-1.44]